MKVEDTPEILPAATAPQAAAPRDEWYDGLRPQRRSFGAWLRARTAEQWAFAAIIALGVVLRFWGLADRPLHHDESMHAYFSLQFLLNPSGYLYDPILHGPFQFHIIPIFIVLTHLVVNFYQWAIVGGILAHFLSPTALQAFTANTGNGEDDFAVRILPALMGSAMLIMPYGLRRQLGTWGALAMSFLLAISPTFVYYSRFVRDDIYVTCFTLLIVLAAVQYAQTRRTAWLLTVIAALTLSYTAMENTFFTIAAFGSFLLALILWDVGPMVGRRLSGVLNEREQQQLGRLALLAPFGLVLAGLALVGLHWLAQLSATINTLAAAHPGPTDPLNPDVAIEGYQHTAVVILLAVSIMIALGVIIALAVQFFTMRGAFAEADVQRSSLGWQVDPARQPVLDTLLATPWIRWFLGFVVAWVLFAVFFWQLPANPGNLSLWGQGFQEGIGRGLLRGIYYWLEQQQVARGGQPWYYYLVLIPLYEPLALVFGLAGIVRALVQPTRFRIFLVYWFGINLLLYSWAGEKMPWLVIHIMLPLIALAALALDWALSTLVRGARTWWTPTRVLAALGVGIILAAPVTMSVAASVGVVLWLSVAGIAALAAAFIVEAWARRRAVSLAERDASPFLPPAPRWLAGWRQGTALGTLALAAVLLAPTLWNTQRVNFYDSSVAPNEMLSYVQTTTDVQHTMQKIDALDKALYHGTHQLHIGVTGGAVWPFAWYLHEYPNTYYSYVPAKGTALPEVIIADLDGGSLNVTSTVGANYQSKQYRLRWWWDESYKPPPCTATKTTFCTPLATWGTGVGPFLWLSYGAFPPPGCANVQLAKCDPANAPFNAADAANRYWSWLWLRQNISGTSPGSTDFMLFIRTDLTQIEQP